MVKNKIIKRILDDCLTLNMTDAPLGALIKQINISSDYYIRAVTFEQLKEYVAGLDKERMEKTILVLRVGTLHDAILETMRLEICAEVLRILVQGRGKVEKWACWSF